MDQQDDQKQTPGFAGGGLLTSWLSKRLLQNRFPQTPKIGLGWWGLLNEAVKDWNRTPEERLAHLGKQWDQWKALEDRTNRIARDVLPSWVNDYVDPNSPIRPLEVSTFNAIGPHLMAGLGGDRDRIARIWQAAQAEKDDLRARTPYGPPRPRRNPLDFRPDFVPIPKDKVPQPQPTSPMTSAPAQPGPPPGQIPPPMPTGHQLPPGFAALTAKMGREWPQAPGPTPVATTEQRADAMRRLAAMEESKKASSPLMAAMAQGAPQAPPALTRSVVPPPSPAPMPVAPPPIAPPPGQMGSDALRGTMAPNWTPPAPQAPPAPPPQAPPPPPKRIVRQATMPQAPSAPKAQSSPMMDMFRRNAAMMRDPATGELIDPGGAASAPLGILSGLFG